MALLNIFASNVLGLLAVIAGALLVSNFVASAA